MNIFDNIAVGFRGLRANGMRSALTVLGIFIGVLAVIMGTAIGQGSRVKILESVQSLGANSVVIFPSQDREGKASGDVSRVTLKDVEILKEKCPTLIRVSASYTGNAKMKYRRRSTGAQVSCATPELLAIRDVKVLLKTAPFLPNDQTLGMGTKTGGRIAVGKDGFLYVTIGDRDNAGTRPWGVAQVNDTHLGKIVRITKDGAPAPGNPFIGVAGALPEIWAIGFRSQEGLAFDANGTLWETEHGPRGGDELNIIGKGKNYGWPIISHGIDYRAGDIGDGEVIKPGMEQPAYFWSPSVAVAGLAFYQGKSRAWKDSVFIGLLNGRGISRLKLVNNKAVEEEVLLNDRKARIRDVRMGPDGALYAVTDSGGTAMSVSPPATGQLLKITPNR